MVFIGRLKTDIKKTLFKFVWPLAIIFAITAFIVNAVFADTGLIIPVEIIWNDNQNAGSTRPTQVILTLRENGNVIQTATVNQSNVSSSDPNKWTYSFTGVNYTSSSVFEISQEPFSGYQIDGPAQSIVSSTPGSSSPQEITNIPPNNNQFTTLDEAYDNLLFEVKGKYYLWTYDDYTSSYTTLAASMIEHLGLDISASDVVYFHGHNSQNPDSPKFILIRHYVNDRTFGTITQVRLKNNRQIESMYSSTVSAYTGTPVVLTNVREADRTVSYQFTGDVQPPNAPQLLPSSAQYTPGDTVTVAQDPTASGYRFLGWKINGADAGSSFTMPDNDVVIAGSWEQFNGYFTPTISQQITNPQTVYRYGDTVEFQIYVTNTANYPITNVEVTEGFVGAHFLAASGYTVSGTGDVATIATIPANGTVVLYAEFPIAEDVTQTLTNTAEITAASASNYYFLDPNQSYIASAQFATQSWQDVPVLTGVNTNSTTLYIILMVIGAIGIAGGCCS